MKKHLLVVLMLISFLPACGSDDGDAFIFNLTVGTPNLRVGEATILSIEFAYSFDEVFSDRDRIPIAVRVPAELDYRVGSAEITGRFSDEDIDPAISRCDTGETFLQFRINDEDLDELSLRPFDSFDGDDEGEITLTLDANSLTERAVIEAAVTDLSDTVDCDALFSAERSTSVAINP